MNSGELDLIGILVVWQIWRHKMWLFHVIHSLYMRFRDRRAKK